MNRDSPALEVKDFKFFSVLVLRRSVCKHYLCKEDDSFMIEPNICLLVRFNSTTLLTSAENLFRN